MNKRLWLSTMASLLLTLVEIQLVVAIGPGTHYPSSACTKPSWCLAQSHTRLGLPAFCRFAVTTTRRDKNRGIAIPCQLNASFRSNSGPGNVKRPSNEFSRTYRTDKILGGGPRQRDYGVSIEAEEEERSLLAQRFDLSNIDKLQADLSLRREPREVYSGSTGLKGIGVEVEGTVRARVTQTCVRSNEAFDVDLEFPIFAVVRPIVAVHEDDDDVDMQALHEAAGVRKDKKKSVRGNNLNEMDMMELQKLLQDFDVEDDVIEDESIYSSRNNILDVGELVSQLFWLKLDPYPKKPGTGPIFSSISG